MHGRTTAVRAQLSGDDPCAPNAAPALAPKAFNQRFIDQVDPPRALGCAAGGTTKRPGTTPDRSHVVSLLGDTDLPSIAQRDGYHKALTTALQSRGLDTRPANVGVIWTGVGLANGDNE